MELTIADLAKKMSVSISTIRTYTSRPEFSHVNLIHGILYNIDAKDMFILKTFIAKKNRFRGGIYDKKSIN